jgi:hypothetical protein
VRRVDDPAAGTSSCGCRCIASGVPPVAGQIRGAHHVGAAVRAVYETLGGAPVSVDCRLNGEGRGETDGPRLGNRQGRGGPLHRGLLRKRNLDDVTRIGIDEVSYKKGHKYLTLVTDLDGRRC